MPNSPSKTPAELVAECVESAADSCADYTDCTNSTKDYFAHVINDAFAPIRLALERDARELALLRELKTAAHEIVSAVDEDGFSIEQLSLDDLREKLRNSREDGGL